MMLNLQLTATEADTTPYKPEVLSIIAEHNRAGTTFNNGLLRFLNAPGGAVAEENLTELFGERAVELTLFAIDWRGRYFCRVMIEGQDMALRADSAFNEASPLMSYEDTLGFLMRSPEAIDFLEAPMMEAAFERDSIYGLPYDRCFGLKIPAFLGGEESLENLEDSDIEVYWSFNSQVYHQVKDLPPGAPIPEIRIEN